MEALPLPTTLAAALIPLPLGAPKHHESAADTALIGLTPLRRRSPVGQHFEAPAVPQPPSTRREVPYALPSRDIGSCW
jgi:hypothetical protein